MDRSFKRTSGQAPSAESGEPLTTRAGMLTEALKSSRHYPTIYVVVSEAAQIPVLQSLFVRLVDEPVQVCDRCILLPHCSIQFGTAEGVERYRGSIPVFYDPTNYRKAA
jgi:hypothetical protein